MPQLRSHNSRINSVLAIDGMDGRAPSRLAAVTVEAAAGVVRVRVGTRPEMIATVTARTPDLAKLRLVDETGEIRPDPVWRLIPAPGDGLR